jgi:hypothetical protein
MTRKNAAKVRARARQEQFGGKYQRHLRDAGGGDGDDKRPISITLAANYWPLVLFGLQEVAKRGMLEIARLGKEGKKPSDFTEIETTALAGPRVALAQMVDQLIAAEVLRPSPQFHPGCNFSRLDRITGVT